MGEVYIGAGDIPTEAGQIGRTGSDGWSKGQQNVQEFDSILFLYAPRKGLHSIGDLQHCVNCEYVWLAGNQLERIHKLSALCYLRLLDISSNRIETLPDANFFAGLECLQTLFLHDNEIQKIHGISGLGGCAALRVLTLHSTPLASLGAYRSMTLSLCPSLLCLDGAVITDKDHLPESDPMLSALTLYSEMKHSMLPPVMQVDEESAYEMHALSHLYTMMATYRNYSMARAHLVLQRVVRGHQGRLIFRARRKVIIPAVSCMQRWLLRRYLETKALAAYCAACAEPRERRVAALEQLPLAAHHGWHSKQESNAIYFFASDVLAVQALIKSCRKVYSSVQDPRVELTDILTFRCSDSVSKTPGIPLVRGVVGRLSHTRRSTAQTCKLLRIKAYPSIREIVSFSVIHRHGYSVNTSERKSFWEAENHSHEFFKSGCERMIRVTFGSTRGGIRFAAVATTINRCIAGAKNDGHRLQLGLSLNGGGAGDAEAADGEGLAKASNAARRDTQGDLQRVGRIDAGLRAEESPEPVRLFLPLALRRITATCAIQALVRSFRFRSRMNPSLGTRLLHLRCARVIQAWWRWKLLHHRLEILKETKLRADSIDANTLYIVTSGLRRRLKEIDAAPRVLRESRIPFDVSHKGHVFVLPFVEERDEGRDLIPRWMGLSIPVETLAAQVGGKAIGQRVTGLLEISASITAGVVPRRGVKQGGGRAAGAGAGDESESRFELNGMAVPRPTLLGTSGVMKVTFDNVHEARARMALVLLNSWRPRTRDPILIVPEEEAVLRLQATLMQAIFRGYVARRWFRLRLIQKAVRFGPLRRLLSEHLETSLFDEQRYAWAALGRQASVRYEMNQPSKVLAREMSLKEAQFVEENVGWEGGGGAGEADEWLHGSRIDADLIMVLQSDNLRLAGLRPSTASSRRLAHTAQEKEQIAAMERYKRDLTKQEAQDKGHDKLTKHCDEIRIQRETRQIVAHLRSRPSGISLRMLQKPAMLERMAAKQQGTAPGDKVRAVKAAHVEAVERQEALRQERLQRIRAQKEDDEFKLQVAALRRRTPKPRPDSATSNPVSREMRNVRHDTRDFSLQMACNINMLSQHIQRAEKERFEQVKVDTSRRQVVSQRLQAQGSAAESKLQRAMSARFRARQNRVEKDAIENFVKAKKTVQPMLKALESGSKGKSFVVVQHQKKIRDDLLASAKEASLGARGGARPASALAYAATPTHDSAVGHAAEAAVRPASPKSPKESANGLGRALSPRQFYEQVRPWTSSARRADGTRVGGHMFIQVHQRAPAGESERGGGGNERQAPGGGGGPADLHHYHDSRPLSALGHSAAKPPSALVRPNARPSTGMAASRFQAQRSLGVYTGGQADLKGKGGKLDSPAPSMWETQQTPNSAVSLPRANRAYLEQ